MKAVSSYESEIPPWLLLDVRACVLDRYSHVRLGSPMGCSQAPLSMGILQARILEWVAMTSRGLSLLRDWTHFSCLLHWQTGSLPLGPPGKPSFRRTYAKWGLPWWLSWYRIHLQCKQIQFRSLSQKDPLEKEMATHSSIPAWRTPWTEEPVGDIVHGVAKSQIQLRN